MLPWTTAEEAVARIAHGGNVFVHGAAMTPSDLLQALCARPDLRDARAWHLHLMGPCPLADDDVPPRVRSVSLFTGASMRGPVNAGTADFVPVFLSDIPDLFRSGRVRLDAALITVSPPDRHGNCTLGGSCDAALAAVQSARHVIAEVNPRAPRSHGAAVIPASAITAAVAVDRAPHVHDARPPDEVEQAIGARIAALIPDGACLQMGIGAIPDAALACLGDKHDLGVHTEMFSDGLLPLLRAGNVTNRRKAIHPGRTVTSFVMGTQAVYDHIDDNALVELHPCDRTNDTALIRKNDDVVAINAAIELDLTGQVCADSIGHRIFSGIGGQMDFIRGAAVSRRGLPIIALPSTARGGEVSRIVPALKPGAGVVTTRGHVHWVVTEHGAADLHGLDLRRRAELLIELAHPDHRPELRQALREVRHIDLGAGAA